MRESLVELTLWNLKPLETVPAELGSKGRLGRARVSSRRKRRWPKGFGYREAVLGRQTKSVVGQVSCRNLQNTVTSAACSQKCLIR